MKNLHVWTLVVMGLFCAFAVACKKDKDEEPKMYKVTNTSMGGDQENPAVTSIASGSFDATYNPES